MAGARRRVGETSDLCKLCTERLRGPAGSCTVKQNPAWLTHTSAGTEAEIGEDGAPGPKAMGAVEKEGLEAGPARPGGERLELGPEAPEPRPSFSDLQTGK